MLYTLRELRSAGNRMLPCVFLVIISSRPRATAEADYDANIIVIWQDLVSIQCVVHYVDCLTSVGLERFT